MGNRLSEHVSPPASSSYPTVHAQRQTSASTTAEAAIAENPVTMFSKTYCGFCRRAERLFRTEFPDVPVKILQLDERDDGAAIQQYLLEKTGQDTVPYIFINQRHVGGCDDVVSLNRRGQLAKLVKTR